MGKFHMIEWSILLGDEVCNSDLQTLTLTYLLVLATIVIGVKRACSILFFRSVLGNLKQG